MAWETSAPLSMLVKKALGDLWCVLLKAEGVYYAPLMLPLWRAWRLLQFVGGSSGLRFYVLCKVGRSDSYEYSAAIAMTLRGSACSRILPSTLSNLDWIFAKSKGLPPTTPVMLLRCLGRTAALENSPCEVKSRTCCQRMEGHVSSSDGLYS